jgi:hypothetical protein
MTKQNVSRGTRAKIGGKAAVEPCDCCGIAPGPLGKPLAVTFENPDVVFDIVPELLETWGGDPFLAIKDVGFFLRVLMPVELTDGFAVEFGTWLETDADDFRTAWQTWNFPEYKDLVVQGYIANTIAPWDKFGHSLVTAVVREPDRVPFVIADGNAELETVMGTTWPHARVLSPYVDLLRADAPPADQPA